MTLFKTAGGGERGRKRAANMINKSWGLGCPDAFDLIDAVLEDEAAGRFPKDDDSQAQTLIRLGRKADLFCTPEGEAFATWDAGGHRETRPVGSRRFRGYLTRSFAAQEAGKPPSGSALSDALGLLEAEAQDGETRKVHTRVAYEDDAIYLDLADDDWRAVKVTAEGWEVVSAPPVRFHRPGGMLALPEPERGGSLATLGEHVNVSGDGLRLVMGWLIGALAPAGPYPLLVLHGEQGTAKSTATRRLRSLIDPAASPTRGQPTNYDRDLAIAARHGRVLAFDNLSYLPPALSDALARLATGGGFGTRTLYTNDEESVFYESRPVVMNGISALPTRPDLLDRSLVVRLDRIPDERRQPERELDEAWAAALPSLLGGLLDAVSAALANRERREAELRGERLPRMADFAVWAEAAAPSLGWQAGEFLSVYGGNRAESVELEIEASPVALAVLAFMEGRAEWEGSMSELFEALPNPGDAGPGGRAWPQTPKGLGDAMARLAPVLRAADVEYKPTGRKTRSRATIHELRRVGGGSAEGAEGREGPTLRPGPQF